VYWGLSSKWTENRGKPERYSEWAASRRDSLGRYARRRDGGLSAPPEDALEQELQAAWKKDPKEFGPYPQIKRIMDTVYDSQDERMIAELTKATRDALRVGCFSERRDSILMWSHYADHHRGICIEYETRWLSIPEAIGLLHPVNYHPELFDVTEYFRSVATGLQ
jgi:Protein of unknown function (DUF2971)